MTATVEIKVPDIGDFKQVEVIEVLVKEGDTISVDDSLITLETDKATMDVPAPAAGTVRGITVKVGDKVSYGSLILMLESADKPAPGSAVPTPAPVPTAAAMPSATTTTALAAASTAPRSTDAAQPTVDNETIALAHASPSIRRFARELGVTLERVKGTGPKNRILKEDIHSYVKNTLSQPTPAAAGAGVVLASMPNIDFGKFGPVDRIPLSRIRKLSGANLHRNWVSIPHVTQHDEADITELEAFRKASQGDATRQDVRLTMLAFLVKASVAALREFPDFNASLSPEGDALIRKGYFHIGVAVDTPDGLVVPVLRDVDGKGVLQIARELGTVSARAREKKLSGAEMQGGCFSISSLGGIGGTAFTPIINAPEVAILGVSRSSVRPVFRDGQIVPRLILPLSLSYDHRVIDGASGARFTTYLCALLADIRKLVL